MPVDISKIPTGGYNTSNAHNDSGSDISIPNAQQQQTGESKEDKDSEDGSKTPRMPKIRGSR